MRTTVRLVKGLLERARKEAARRGVTLTSLIEEGLRLNRPTHPRVTLPECRGGGGSQPGVELNDSAALLARMKNNKLH